MRVSTGAVAFALFIGVAGQAVAQPPLTTPDPASSLNAVTPEGVEPGFATSGLTDPDAEPRDKYEKLNRTVWGFNQTVDRIVLKPVSSVYRTITPRPARRGISRIFANLSEPWSFVNNLLQGHPGRAMNNLGRFVVNTTIGVGGLADHATKLGLRDTPEDFGQTLAVWGVKHSAYLVLPILGPSTVRDGIGSGVAFFADPYQICLNNCVDLSRWTRRGITALSVVSLRADLTESGADAFLQSSLDPYAAARSAFLQRRAAAILNQDDDDGAGAAAGADPAATDPAPPTATTPTAPASPAAVPPPATPAATPTTTPIAAAGNPPRLAYVLP